MMCVVELARSLCQVRPGNKLSENEHFLDVHVVNRNPTRCD